ncbi:TetR/AcrR family transcriptional regulator [Psychrosphaera aestuarii]|uniref:TetR/AcrR family transcriptional regulator n=1 Tax=Psychrosphaera aestuarii TaxID=1266052 RepID=UPI001B33CDBB|nr:TetR/AcrR family transcriptional regulator [Psychrosphaera aestuarii]
MTSGRKKSFSELEALEAAMHVFWSKGYVGASLSALTESMGINKPSMYSTFGNKEALFVKSTSYYVEQKMKPHLRFLYEPNIDLIQRLKNYLYSIVAMQCESNHPKGCYLVLCQSELAGGDIPESAAQQLRELDALPQNVLIDLLTTDAQSIKRGLDKNANNIALTLYTVLKGTASMARSGATLAELSCVVDNVLDGVLHQKN